MIVVCWIRLGKVHISSVLRPVNDCGDLECLLPNYKRSFQSSSVRGGFRIMMLQFGISTGQSLNIISKPYVVLVLHLGYLVRSHNRQSGRAQAEMLD